MKKIIDFKIVQLLLINAFCMFVQFTLYNEIGFTQELLYIALSQSIYLIMAILSFIIIFKELSPFFDLKQNLVKNQISRAKVFRNLSYSLFSITYVIICPLFFNLKQNEYFITTLSGVYIILTTYIVMYTYLYRYKSNVYYCILAPIVFFIGYTLNIPVINDTFKYNGFVMYFIFNTILLLIHTNMLFGKKIVLRKIEPYSEEE
ncbi:MAG: hypothetical protein ACRCUP_01840 [Mycoplasmatales bacterium]